MHHQAAHAALVHRTKHDLPDGPAIARERFRCRARFGSDEIAHRATSEVVEAQRRRAIARRDRSLSRRFGRQDGEKRLVWTITKELELAVLIDGTERRDGRRAFAVLAETLGPKLPPPGAHRVE